MKILGKPLTMPAQFTKDKLIRYLISLPLNSLPVVGTGLFVVYNGQPYDIQRDLQEANH